MKMNENLQHLQWLLAEVEISFKEATEALEKFMEDPADTDQLVVCMRCVNQVQGALRVINVPGPLLLTDEIEQLADALMTGDLDDVLLPASEMLAQGMLRLPIYLRQLASTHVDNAASLLVVLNDLRAVRNQPSVSSEMFFNPDIARAMTPSGKKKAVKTEVFAELIDKLHKMYQVALRKMVTREQFNENHDYLKKVCDRLFEMSSGTPSEIVWRSSLALLEGIGDRSISLGPAVRNLLESLQGEIGRLAGTGFDGFNDQPPELLVKDILFYIAHGQCEEEISTSLRKEFELDSSLPEGALFESDRHFPSAGGDDISRALASSFASEVDFIKDNLERYLVNGDDASLLSNAYTSLKRLADSLLLVGSSDLSAASRDIVLQMEALQDADDDDRSGLIAAIADKMVEVEAGIYHWLAKDPGYAEQGNQGSRIVLDGAGGSLLDESRKSLETIKEAIVNYIASQWQLEKLDGIPELLVKTSGAFKVLDYPRIAHLLEGCNDFITYQLLSNPETDHVQWNKLDALAEALACIEYYLDMPERNDDLENPSQILARAEQKLTELGCFVTEEESMETVSSEALSTSATEQQTEIASETVVDSAVRHISTEEAGTDEASLEVTDEDDEDFIDQEILEIFVEEVTEVIGELQNQYPQWVADPTNSGTLNDIRRGFHTLKGSGRMVGAEILGKLAWSVEDLLNRVIDNRVTNNPTIMAFVDLAMEQVIPLTQAFESRQPVTNQPYIDQLIETAEQLSQNESVELPQSIAVVEEEPEEAITTETEETVVSEAPAEESPQPVEYEDHSLYEIFVSEAELHLKTVQVFIAEQKLEAPLYTYPPGSVQRALHTLKGSAKMANIEAIDAIVEPLEHFVKELFNRQIDVNADIVKLMEDAVGGISQAIAKLSNREKAEIDNIEELLSRLHELRDRTLHTVFGGDTATDFSRQASPEMLNALMTEGMQQALSADQSLLDWLENADNSFIPVIAGEMDSLKQAAEKAGIEPLQMLAEKLGLAYSHILNMELPAEACMVDVLRRSHECLLDMADTVAASLDVPPLDETIASELQNITTLEKPETDLESLVESETETEPEPEEAAVPEKPEFKQRELAQIYPLDAAEIDLELIEVFLQEVEELGQSLDEAFSRWRQDAQDPEPVEIIKRDLHTFKGGARMTGLFQLGDMTHDLESDVIELSADASLLNEELFSYLFSHLENINRGVDQVRTLYEGAAEPQPVEVDDTPDSQEQPESEVFPESDEQQDIHAEEIVQPAEETATEPDGQDSDAQRVEEITAQESTVDDQPTDVDQSAVEDVVQETTAVTQPVQLPEFLTGKTIPDVQRKQVAQQMVRVAAPILEKLVNLAGESSISRGRIEQQVSGFYSSLEEMEATILRLQGHVRLLGIETEAQIMFRREQIEASESNEGFDPLEMDRFSQLQQLARGLIEASSDLQDLRSTLVNTARDTETQLLEQSRIQSELQESLMRAQMVPFSNIVPRLRRIVRQVSDELGRQVNLNLTNQEGEMDRSVLEKMIAPLEHMIRNAIDHGLEDSKQRSKAGKPEVGNISIGLQRTGSEVVLKIADDGRGLNIDRIRKKAIDKGLMESEAKLTDHEVSQFIFSAGFSTSETVTQVSGRGVGMDVVYSQVRQLGGSVELNSFPGQGTEFNVRLPFTVSVNRALMVKVRDDLFALPLNSINGVVNIPPAELEKLYLNPEQKLNYGGVDYDIFYLGSLLSEDLRPKVDSIVPYHSLVLVQSEAGYYAVHVDQMLASQEVVVKSLGVQFSTVSGLSGATILGDGRVVVILDLMELLRAQVAFMSHKVNLITSDTEVETTSHSVQQIMVVDDSVTVRKVTGRFLQREGFEVITATDGVEAMQLLQDHQPDLMLLDIEMPRMDGFEVARRVRNAERWKNIPIIMITSRTGDKHREKAMALGVNGYVGKPYQEDSLLEHINELIEARVT